MKKCIAAVLALGLILAPGALPAEVLPPAAQVSAAAVIPAPQNIRASSDCASLTLSWDAVEGAAGYCVYEYYEDSDEYELLAEVSMTSVTFPAMPFRSYSFKVCTERQTVDGMTEGKLSKAVKVRTKGHMMLKFPDPKKYGLPDMPIAAAAGLRSIPGSFGTELTYGSEEEYSGVMKKIGAYKKQLEKAGFVFGEEIGEEASDDTNADIVSNALVYFNEVNAARFMVIRYEERVDMVMIPYDIMQYSPEPLV